MTTETNGAAATGAPVWNEQEWRAFTEFAANAWSSRQDFFSRFLDPRSDVDRECRYPSDSQLTAEFYRALVDRTGVAERVVELYPKECWQVTPTVFEDKSAKSRTSFERAWDDVCNGLYGGSDSPYRDEEGSLIWTYAQRLDVDSGIGQYGILLLGFDDGLDLDQPVPGFAGLPPGAPPEQAYPQGTDAQYDQPLLPPMVPPSAAPPGQRRLLYLRVFDQSLASVAQFETDPRSPRYGQPVIYSVTFNDPHAAQGGLGAPSAVRRVHWSRVIHVADGEVFGKPRLRPVVDHVLNLRKLYGGDAEMYWQGAFPGLALETYPTLGPDVKVPEQKIRDMMTDYRTRLQRWIVLMGMSAKSLAPQVADPLPHIEIQLEAICITLGCPVRIFKGSERGELASGQDDSSWNDRVRNRQRTHLTPKLIVPLVNRLIDAGVLPRPKQYYVSWPDLDSVSDKDKSTIALQDTQALVAYVSGGGEQVVPPQDFLTKILGWDEDDAAATLADAEQAQEEALAEQEALAEEMGFEPAPPDGYTAPEPPAPVKVKPGEKLVVPPGGRPKPSVNVVAEDDPLYVEMSRAVRADDWRINVAATDAGFLEAICADPRDVGVRLIYADWLDDHGEEERAEFFRVQCELATLPEPEVKTVGRFEDHPGAVEHGICQRCAQGTCRVHPLHRRERELFLGLDPWWWANWVPGDWTLTTHARFIMFRVGIQEGIQDIWCQVGRGFVEGVGCRLEDWLTYGPVMIRKQPILRVYLVDATVTPSSPIRQGSHHPVQWARHLAGLPGIEISHEPPTASGYARPG